MTKRQLAQALRQRQYILGMVPEETLDNLSDDDVIDSYITCSRCGYKQAEGQELEAAIRQARSAEHFFDICNSIQQSKHSDEVN